jgi:hypothetical protein
MVGDRMEYEIAGTIYIMEVVEVIEVEGGGQILRWEVIGIA